MLLFFLLCLNECHFFTSPSVTLTFSFSFSLTMESMASIPEDGKLKFAAGSGVGDWTPWTQCIGFLLKVFTKIPQNTHLFLVLSYTGHWYIFWMKKLQTYSQTSLLHNLPKPTPLTLWIASHRSTLAWCSGELVSSAHPLEHSLLSVLLKEVSASQGLVTLNWSPGPNNPGWISLSN